MEKATCFYEVAPWESGSVNAQIELGDRLRIFHHESVTTDEEYEIGQAWARAPQKASESFLSNSGGVTSLSFQHTTISDGKYGDCCDHKVGALTRACASYYLLIQKPNRLDNNEIPSAFKACSKTARCLPGNNSQRQWPIDKSSQSKAQTSPIFTSWALGRITTIPITMPCGPLISSLRLRVCSSSSIN